jgi:hypothetical protein
MPAGQARTLIRRGRALSHLPAFASAWSKGAINAAHVDAVAAVRNPSTEEALARDEQVLCDQAAALSFDRYEKAISYWHQFADPDGTETSHDKRVAARDVYLEKSFDEMWLGHLTMDPVSGSAVATELNRLEHELFEAEWAKAKKHLGKEPTVADLERTPGQRRCDALAEMAKRSRTAPANGKRPAPLISVLVDFPTLTGRICELANGTVLPPGALVPLLDQAYFERAVYRPDNRVEVSETTRLFTGATRRAIELRDRECTHPYCDLPASDCQADHIIPYTEGGPTNQENGRLLCGFHNRQRNERPPPT